jgi:hypothetical protein
VLSESSISACASYVTERARHVIESFGPRPPGSEAERKTQELVRDELASCCDGEVLFEPFQVSGKAFFSMHAVAASLLIVSLVLWRVHPALSVTLDALALSVWYFQLVRYRLYLDPFFPKSTSYNVYGRIKPTGKTKRRIILSGHADAACEFRYGHLVPRLFRYITMALFTGLAGIVMLHLLGLATWFAGGAPWAAAQRLGSLQLLLIPGILLGVSFNSINSIVPGANDNLSGVFAAVGIAKHLKESGVQLRHTELGIAVLGSEEAGLRGAKVFANRYKAKFEEVETIVIVLETLRDLEHLKVYNRDMNGTVKHDAEVCRLLREAGEECGLHLPYGSVYLGSSDASAFTQAGWRAGQLAAMDPRPPDYYHTRRDNWDNMDEECLRKAIAVVCTAIRIYDAGQE